MSIRWQKERQAVINAAQDMALKGLTTGTSGNVSLRLPLGPLGETLVAITPTSQPYPDLRPDDIVVVDLDLNQIDGEGIPSSESLLHTETYRKRPDVGAIMHTHSVFATVAAVNGTEIPPIIDEALVAMGGPVKVSEYAFPASQELARNVVAALGQRNAALIRNHGAICVGIDLSEALNVSVLLERLAQIHFFASMSCKAKTLPPDVIEAEIAIFDMRRRTQLDRIDTELRGREIG